MTVGSGSARSTSRHSGTGWLPWLAMAVVALSALAVGTFGQAKPSDAERADHLAGTIRCPSCAGQSAATSDTPSSQAVRALIRDRVRAGDSDEEITDFVVNKYPGTRLDPSGSGFSALIWALPAGLVVVALAGLVLRFRDWRPGALPVSDADRSLVAEALAGSSDSGPSREPTSVAASSGSASSAASGVP